MATVSTGEPAARAYLLPDKGPWRAVVIGAVLLAALVVRVERTANPPVDATPTRQYRSAIIARGLYYRGLDSVPEWEKRVAALNLEKEELLEAPIMEHVAVVGYRIAGGEHLWIPRSLSSLFWVIGGLFLYLIARRLASADAALLAVLFYLFVPYGVATSRTFQRDPLMIMLMLIGIFGIVRHADERSLRWLLVAAVASALSIFIKPVTFFPIFGAYLALALVRTNVIKAVFNPHSILFAVIALVPTIAYTLHGLFVGGFLSEQAGRSFFPETIVRGFFWHGWLVHITKTVGRLAFVVGLFGLFAFRDSFSRALGLGLWIGYFVFGLVFNYGMHTHAYYQLMLIPILALSLTAVADIVLGWLRQAPHLRTAARIVVVLAVCLAVEPLVWQRGDPRFRRAVELREEIGEAIGHSTKTLILDRDNGKLLQYHGKMSGDWWPSRAHFRLFELQGKREISAAERLDAMIEEHEPELFVVVHMAEYRAQKDLKEVLTRRYPTLHETDRYLVFDLRAER